MELARCVERDILRRVRGPFALLAVLALGACNGTVRTTPSGTGGSGGATTAGTGGAPVRCMSTADCDGGAACDMATGVCLTASCTCACTDSLPAGCANVCTMSENGPPLPHFCNGDPALSQCSFCLQQRCGFTAAETQNPALCQ
jgi:hypothetical protein